MVIRMLGKKLFEENDYEDFFSRFDFINYPDDMEDFDDK